ncbi:MAG: hypothetical protein PHG04_01815, partial [Candidatus Nanoarchaeia archaeon]|nr:hypothetical protein [Candidatus Nanoarchaeia archaeon]
YMGGLVAPLPKNYFRARKEEWHLGLYAVDEKLNAFLGKDENKWMLKSPGEYGGKWIFDFPVSSKDSMINHLSEFYKALYFSKKIQDSTKKDIKEGLSKKIAIESE